MGSGSFKVEAVFGKFDRDWRVKVKETGFLPDGRMPQIVVKRQKPVMWWNPQSSTGK
jgi:hypothetical protein